VRREIIVVRSNLGRCGLVLAVLIVALVAALPLGAAEDNNYTVTRLVSDQPGVATFTDPNLVNAWGLAASATSPWWVADNETSKSTLYNGNTGQPQALVVSVGTDSGPTGVVFNNTSGFVVTNGTVSAPARFIFDSEDGLIRGWNPTVNATNAVVAPAMGDPGANYKGLAIAAGMLYAADFHNGVVDVFDGSWSLVDQFTDPGLPNGYAPFGIQAIGSQIFVAFAKQDEDAEDEVAGQGLGFVDAFDTAGNLVARVAQRGQLNAPWGLALAPTDFGRFSGDLLVGNFGDGEISAYEHQSNGHFAFRGQLRDDSGQPISIDGLWALGFGNGANAGPRDNLFFTAGPDDETHGLFGRITVG
jgi:uncharacterized protein (TIGR03118 family)